MKDSEGHTAHRSARTAETLRQRAEGPTDPRRGEWSDEPDPRDLYARAMWVTGGSFTVAVLYGGKYRRWLAGAALLVGPLTVLVAAHYDRGHAKNPPTRPRKPGRKRVTKPRPRHHSPCPPPAACPKPKQRD